MTDDYVYSDDAIPEEEGEGEVPAEEPADNEEVEETNE